MSELVRVAAAACDEVGLSPRWGADLAPVLARRLGAEPRWSSADLDLIADALLSATDNYATRAAEVLDDDGVEASEEWTRKSERTEALFERVCRELDRLKRECPRARLHGTGPRNCQACDWTATPGGPR